MRVLDVADDLGASLLARFPLDQLPAFVKTAEWREPGEARDRDFALVLVDTDGSRHRKYACHDPGSTLVSMLYLEQAQAHLNPAAIKVAAATLSGLARDWRLEVPASIDKLAALDLSEEEQRRVLGERTVRYAPPRAHAKIASAPAGAFDKLASARQQWHLLGPYERRETAVELVKLASEVPLVVPPELARYAGDGLSPKFASHMALRAQYAGTPELANGYQELAKIAANFTPESVVEAVYVMDGQAGLRWAGGDRYSEKLADPVLCVYDRVKQAAWSWSHGAEATNENELGDFARRHGARETFTQTFHDALWLKFAADPVGTFKAMPREQQVLVSRMAREL